MQTECIITPLTWALAPAWLTLDEASRLSGYSLNLLHFLIQDGGVEAKRESDSYLIEKQSLLDFRECLALVLHWND